RPVLRQGLSTKAVEKATYKSLPSEAVKSTNTKSFVDRKVEPVIFPPVLVSTEVPAESAACAVATPQPVAPVEFTATPAIPPMIAETVSSPLTDCSATDFCAAPAQEAPETNEAAPSLAQEATVAETCALPDHERSDAAEFAPIPTTVQCPANFEPFPVFVQEVVEAIQMPLSLVTEYSASDFAEPSAPQPSESEVSQRLLVAGPAEQSRVPSLMAFYGLNQQPFDVTPDPAYLYQSRVHREAFTALSQGIENLRGFVALIAEPGMGKTTLLNKLMEELRDSARVIFLFQTQCNSSELLRYLLTELGIEHDGMDIVAMHRALSQVLFDEMLQGRRFVLIVDEAQNLQDTVLETIRLLSDYETTHSKLIQIVLAGQPQLVDTLMRPGLVQLRQRIAVVANLEPLDAAETAEYIEHRLRAAGSGETHIFTPDAMALIAERSEGIPRCINNICFNAMLAGYLQRQTIIDSEVVKRVASKLDLELLARRPQQDLPVSAPPAASSSSSDLSQLANLLSTALAVRNQPDAVPAVAVQDEAKSSLSLTGRLTEKLTSQSWSDKNEFRIQVSLERDYSPGVPIADHYYCRSFYVSEEQAKSLQPGKAVRVKFEQD
ncbi:MAG TPA: AAA family ATPase, partial [Pyrinomonadaceae bacterium]|nr:AAA family ATPase [Pyrinomonadaceae bacterium]